MKVMELLDKVGIKYEVMEHEPAFTAQSLAAAEHERGQYVVAKSVVIKADGTYVMCVLPACYKINLDALKNGIGAKKVSIAEEKELEELFDDCELGAEPPFGRLYNLETIMDKSLEADDHIVFQAGSHDKSIRMSMDDYRKLAKPKILAFSYHMT